MYSSMYTQVYVLVLESVRRYNHRCSTVGRIMLRNPANRKTKKRKKNQKNQLLRKYPKKTPTRPNKIQSGSWSSGLLKERWKLILCNLIRTIIHPGPPPYGKCSSFPYHVFPYPKIRYRWVEWSMDHRGNRSDIPFLRTPFHHVNIPCYGVYVPPQFPTCLPPPSALFFPSTVTIITQQPFHQCKYGCLCSHPRP